MPSTSTPPSTAPSAASPVPSTAPSASLSQLRALVAGGFGGVCAVVVGHPFDLVKVRLQTAERGAYGGAIDVVRRSVSRDGLRRGLYAGVSAPLVGVTPMFAVSFWGYDLGKTIVRSFSAPPVSLSPLASPSPPLSSSSAPSASSSTSLPPTPPLSIAQISAAGFLSAIPMTAITAPFERVKVILQVQGQKRLAPGEIPRYAGSGAAVARQLYHEGGLRSVFRGSAATLARDGPGSAAYFATYEVVKRWLAARPKGSGSAGDAGEAGEADHAVDGPADSGADSGPGLLAVMGAGAAAGVAMWVPVFPIDTVKSRLQTSETAVSVRTVVRELYARGGVRAFFPGFAPALVRAVPANAATFLGYELAMQGMTSVFGG